MLLLSATRSKLNSNTKVIRKDFKSANANQGISQRQNIQNPKTTNSSFKNSQINKKSKNVILKTTKQRLFESIQNTINRTASIISQLIYTQFPPMQQIIDSDATKISQKITAIKPEFSSQISAAVANNAESISQQVESLLSDSNNKASNYIVTGFSSCLNAITVSVNKLTDEENLNVSSSLNNTASKILDNIVEKLSTLESDITPSINESLELAINQAVSIIVASNNLILEKIIELLADMNNQTSIMKRIIYIDPEEITSIFETELNSASDKIKSFIETAMLEIADVLNTASDSEEAVQSIILNLSNDDIVISINTQISRMLSLLQANIDMGNKSLVKSIGNLYRSSALELISEMRAILNGSNVEIEDIINSDLENQQNQITTIFTQGNNDLITQINILLSQ